jgi:tetratricopeptide (TPR) repeat protein
MHELKKLHTEKAAKLKTEKAQTVSYKLGNETIIQPVSSTLKDNATLITILNIVIGLVVGAAVVWFLAVPTVRYNMNKKTNKEVIVYSEQIAALESELDLQSKELEGYKASSEATEAEKAVAQGTQANYEALVTALEHYYDSDYDRDKLVDELLSISTESLGTVGKTSYEAIRKEVFEAQCEELYPIGKRSYEAVNYKRAIECLERVVTMNATYKDGEALFMLMDIYLEKDEMEKATEKYNKILELYPDSELANQAKELMKPETEEIE